VRQSSLRLPLLLLAALVAGCTTEVVPPTNPADAVSVFVADNGRHASLILPQPDGGYREYAFGDWNFFALNKDRWYNTAQALFFSPGAALGRRYLELEPQHADAQLCRELDKKRLFRVQVGRAGAMALSRELDDRFVSHQPPVVLNPITGLLLVRDEQPYSLWHNCNHVAAHWLKQLGCDIRGSAMTSAFHLPQAAAATP
jgi:hypothetical protein